MAGFVQKAVLGLLAGATIMGEVACSPHSAPPNVAPDHGRAVQSGAMSDLQRSTSAAEAHKMTATEATSHIQQLAQRTLDLPELQRYYHVRELPERSPLLVVGESLGEVGSKLNKFGKSVVFKRAGEVRADEPIFRFKQIAIENTKAVVDFEYSPEGLVGQATFSRRGGEWEPTKVSLQEK